MPEYPAEQEAFEFDTPEQVDAAAAAGLERTVFGMLRQIARIDADLAAGDRWVAMMVEEEARRAAPLQAKRSFLEEQVKRIAQPLIPAGRKSVDVPGVGRIQYVDRKASFRIVDEPGFIAALGADERARLVEMRPKLRTNEAKAYVEEVVTSTGEQLPGVEIIPARRTATLNLDQMEDAR